jgi:DNA-binding response OmpR family regulator
MSQRLPVESPQSSPYAARDVAPHPDEGRGNSVYDIYDDGHLRVEHQNYYVACDGQSIKMPRTEFLIFSRLARTPQRIVVAAELWEAVWGKEKPLNSESLHVTIYRLRQKLAPHALEIETMVNVGYRLICQNRLR